MFFVSDKARLGSLILVLGQVMPNNLYMNMMHKLRVDLFKEAAEVFMHYLLEGSDYSNKLSHEGIEKLVTIYNKGCCLMSPDGTIAPYIKVY